GLQTGAIDEDWTYTDRGSLEVGGIQIVNWDRGTYGVVTVRDLLINSLNIGASSVALATGPEAYYTMMQDFGFGSPTRIDLLGEAEGVLRVPGDQNWNEADFASNAYGQALAVTPIQ